MSIYLYPITVARFSNVVTVCSVVVEQGPSAYGLVWESAAVV